MNDAQDRGTQPTEPVTPDAGDSNRNDDEAAQKDYYYDDSTGYEIYEGRDDDEGLDGEQQ